MAEADSSVRLGFMCEHPQKIPESGGNNDPLLFGTPSIAGAGLWVRMAKS